MPLSREDATKLIKLRSLEWTEHHQGWRKLYDSLEGGERYRRADYLADPTKEFGDGVSPWSNFGTAIPSGYGPDATTGRAIDITYGQIVSRNLIPHISETSPEGRNLYVLRLERTPVPAFVRLCVQTHLARIYSREVRRVGPDAVTAWWDDTDGRGTPIDRWMVETAAPLLCVLGQLDIAVTKPAAPKGVQVRTKADQTAAGMPDVVVSIVLPENVVNWQLDANASHYEWALTFEQDGLSRGYRHWTREACDYYTMKGEYVADKSWDHALGFVPLRRYFDQRKPRCGNVAVSDYEPIADRSRAFYNLHSEVILNGVLASHPKLQGPEEYVQGDGNVIPTGPAVVLPVKASAPGSGGGGWSYIDPPHGSMVELRAHMHEIAEEIDRLAGLSRPAGTRHSTVAQSGVSKVMDSVDGNALLAKKADTIQAFEIGMAEMVLAVLGQPVKPGVVQVVYPKQFDLYSATDLAQALDDIARIAAGLGAFPLLQAELMDRLVALYLPGIPDDRLDAIRAEIAAKVQEAALAYSALPPPPEPTGDHSALNVPTDANPYGTGPDAPKFNPYPGLGTSRP